MYMDAVLIFTVNISCDVIAFFYDETGLSVLFCFVGKNCTEKSGTDNQIIVHKILLFVWFILKSECNINVKGCKFLLCLNHTKRMKDHPDIFHPIRQFLHMLLFSLSVQVFVVCLGKQELTQRC